MSYFLLFHEGHLEVIRAFCFLGVQGGKNSMMASPFWCPCFDLCQMQAILPATIDTIDTNRMKKTKNVVYAE